MNVETKALREWFWKFLDSRPDLTVSHVAAYTPLSRSMAESFLSHRSGADTDFIGGRTVDEFRRVKAQIESGDILQIGVGSALTVQRDLTVEVRGRGKKPARPFYSTETAKKINTVLEYCAEHAVIGVITADYGVGKSSAVQRWRADKKGGLGTPNCYFEFDEFSRSSVHDFITRLAEVVGIEAECGTARGSSTMRAIIRQLNREPMLVIFDQCETVSPRVLQLMRQIWDGARHAGTGMVMLSSPLLVERLYTPRMKAEVGSLTSRVAVWTPLDGVGRAEMAGILRQEGVTDIDEEAVSAILRMTRGSMRRLMAMAEMLKAKHAGKRVTERNVDQVAGYLWLQTDTRRRAA